MDGWHYWLVLIEKMVGLRNEIAAKWLENQSYENLTDGSCKSENRLTEIVAHIIPPFQEFQCLPRTLDVASSNQLERIQNYNIV